VDTTTKIESNWKRSTNENKSEEQEPCGKRKRCGKMNEPTEKELEEKAEGVFRATKAGMHLVAHGEATELLEMLDAKRENNE
jgi:hypothetical protein